MSASMHLLVVVIGFGIGAVVGTVILIAAHGA
jgi:hypothetical protein